MKITKIRSFVCDLENSKPYTIAFKTITEVNNVFFEVELENGIIGIGSANPSEYVVGESFQQCVSALSADKNQWLVGRSISEFESLLKELFHHTPVNPSARAAIDVALYDAFTQFLGIPLYKYLGRKVKSLETSVTIGIMGVTETLQECKDYVDLGFNTIKVKLGHDLELDIERIRKMREIHGNSIVIRIDANQGYTADQTIRFYTETEGMDVELIEQPIPADQIDELKGLPDRVKRIIAADESLIGAKDAIKLVSDVPACGIFNVKLMKCGGIYQGQKIVDIAENSGIELMFGCNDESRVSITAALNLAYSSLNTKYIDLDGSFDIVKDIVEGGFDLKGGIMTPLDLPGLGIKRIG